MKKLGKNCLINNLPDVSLKKIIRYALKNFIKMLIYNDLIEFLQQMIELSSCKNNLSVIIL
jgi:hypothetical protein